MPKRWPANEKSSIGSWLLVLSLTNENGLLNDALTANRPRRKPGRTPAHCPRKIKRLAEEKARSEAAEQASGIETTTIESAEAILAKERAEA